MDDDKHIVYTALVKAREQAKAKLVGYRAVLPVPTPADRQSSIDVQVSSDQKEQKDTHSR
jgi:hypothetical protein